MRKKTLTGRLLLFALFFLGCSNLMNARSQNALMVSYAQANANLSSQAPGQNGQRDQARAFSMLLAEARKTFDVDFIYESKILPGTKLVMDIDKYRTVEEFLDDLLKPYNLKYKKVLAKAYVIYSSSAELKRLISAIEHQNGVVPEELLHSGSAASRSIPITGRILDQAKGTPLEGVSITVKGGNKGTLTDQNGNFKLQVDNENAVLVFSLIGYETKEIPVSGRTDFQLSLSGQATSLNDVVVVGYGTQKKSVVTGSISSVHASDLEDQPVYRVEDALQGRTTGLTIAASSGQPGSAPTVRIRGTTSINNSDPLYVVDGVPLDDGGFDYLNAGDIESIEVLKDAASAAIYGARAASGVILVTTKHGKAGQMRVAYNGYYGTQAPARTLRLLDATQYATLRNESSLAAGGAILFPDPASLGKGTDWQAQIFNDNASEMSHELSLSGGTDKSTFYTSIGYFDQNGIVATPISWYKRLTVRFNGDHKLKSWLHFGENIGYSYIRNQGLGNTNSVFGGPLGSAINLDPLTPVVITDPNVLNSAPYNNQPVEFNSKGQPYAISNYVGQEETNPLAYEKTQQSYNWSHNFISNAFLAVTPIKGLEVRTSIGTKLAFYGTNGFSPIYYLNASTSNSITNLNVSSAQVFLYNWQNTASYSHSIGLHNFTALIGTEAWNETGWNVDANFQYIPATNLSNASLGYSGSLTNAERMASGGQNVLHTVSSEFGRLNYSYDDKYLLTGIIRRDGSSRFGSDHKYGYFPSASVGWVVTRENFWPVTRAINFLKIRASYGVTGNDNLPDFAYVSTIGGGRNYTFGNTYETGNSPNAPANPDLKWEQTSQANIGFDAVLFNNFTAAFDLYNKKTTGMLLAEQLPLYVGSGNPTGNIADMTNKGVELELGYNKKFGQVGFSAKGNVSYLQNRVTSLGTQPFLVGGTTLVGSAYELDRTQPGYAFNSFYGFKTLGIFQTQAEINSYTNKSGQLIQPNAKPGDFKFADLDHDGAITASDRTFIGDPTPKWSYGMTITANYKGFDILIFGQGAGGNKIWQGLRRLDIAQANYQTKALGRWTGPGTSTDFPRLVDNDPNHNFSNPSPFYLESGTYFRIKTLQIGYTLPQSLMSRYTLQKVRIYVSGYNLFTFTKYDGYDPEIGGGSYGIDQGFYPQARSWQAGLSVGF
jgi:TonB-dependent starch-binding outer membrane protein SusC